MLTLAAFTTLLIIGFAILGFIPAGYLANKISQSDSRKGPVALALAIVIGFAMSGLAATWSFGAFGANRYLQMLGIFLICLILLAFVNPIRNSIRVWSQFSIKDSILIGIPLFASFLVRPYWADMTKVRIAAGQGPDIPQNLMTALSQPNVGNTWFQGRDTFLQSVGSTNLNDAVYHLYQLPSMQMQAGVDYLIYGTRWGLSIPFAQLLKINPENIVYGQGLSISVGLTSLALVMYAFAQIMNLRPTISLLLTISSISSSGFLFQAYNGGMAQAWALAGLAALSLGFFLAIYFTATHQLDRNREFGIFILMTLGWLGNAITYIDSSMILAGAFGITSLFLFFVTEHQVAKKSFYLLVGSGLVAAVLAAPYTFAAMQTMALRLKLAAGTGLVFAHWPLPSEVLGLFNIWTQNDGKPRDGGIMLAGILLTSGIMWIATKGIANKKREDRTLSFLAISIILLCGAVALWSKNTKLGSNYSYVKVSTYLTPLFLMIIGYKLIITKKLNPKIKKSKINLTANYITPIAYTLIILFSAISANSGMVKNAQYVVPKEQMKILNDKAAQSELANFNYLTTYIPASNILGFLGDVNWVGKAPNDQILDKRINKEMRIICFDGDKVCKPKTLQIANSNLNKYGFLVYESPIDTKTYASLKPLDRYYADMDAVGQPRFVVPERFIGGNPLLK